MSHVTVTGVIAQNFANGNKALGSTKCPLASFYLLIMQLQSGKL